MNLPFDVIELIFSYLPYEDINKIMIPFDKHFWKEYVVYNYVSKPSQKQFGCKLSESYRFIETGYTWKQLSQKVSEGYRFINTGLYSPKYQKFFYYEDLLLRDNDIFFHDYGEDMALLLNNEGIIIGSIGYKLSYEHILEFFDVYINLLSLNSIIATIIKKAIRLEHIREKHRKLLVSRFTERKLSYAGPSTSKQVYKILRMPKLISMVNDPIFNPLLNSALKYLIKFIDDPLEYLFEDKLNELFTKFFHYTLCLVAKNRDGYDFLLQDGTIAQLKYDNISNLWFLE